MNRFKNILSSLVLVTLVALESAGSVGAQAACTFYSVSPALTDLGNNQYMRLTSVNPPTYVPTGETGGLYPDGSNVRPAGHTSAGVLLANQIQPLDSSGQPATNGKIGFTSIGMSNTNSEFGTFKSMADSDPTVKDQLVVVNGAAGGGVIERWVNPQHPQYNTYWNYFNNQIAYNELTHAQIQVVWAKVTNQNFKPNFPADMHTLEGQYELLARELKTRLPNVKIIFWSSRTRAFSYFAGPAEPTAFENGFAVKWLLERQIEGDPTLNWDPNLGDTPVPYMSWGPYLWIDGTNPRSDGQVWPLTNVVSTDCVHPSAAGNQSVANMLMDFFKSDPVATPWFLNPGTPVPTPTPTPIVTPTLTPTPTPFPTDGPTPTPTEVPTPTNTSTPTNTPLPTNTPTLSPTPLPAGAPISAWGFGADIVTDDINGCVGCSKTNATWFSPGVVSGAYALPGSTSYLNLGNFPYINNKTAFSMSVRIRPNFDETSTTTRYLFSDGNNVNVFYLSNIADWRATVRNASNTKFTVDSQNLGWDPFTWHMMTLTHGGGQTKLYWDTNLVGSTASTGAVAGDSGATYVGQAVVGGNYFAGDVDELKMFDFALSATEVETLYTNP